MHDALWRDATYTHENADDRLSLHERSHGVVIAIPLYRSPELLPDLTSALLDIGTELRDLRATVLFINDSPDDEALAAALQQACDELSGPIDVERITNCENIGFVRSANDAMARAVEANRDIILLNSDARPTPGALAEMIAVAYLDPLISVVSPRSDNATICNSPVTDRWRGADGAAVFSAHKSLERHLPRYSYVPTAVGFCLFVKRLMVVEFGGFDLAYGAGYNEENDFIRRCNQRGYRAVLANHAFVHHIGEVSFSKSEIQRADRQQVNHVLLMQRYPEYDRIIQRYFTGPDFCAERVLSGILPLAGRTRILFDCRVMGIFFNGTFEHITHLLTAFARLYSEVYDIRILCDLEAFRFHGLDRVPGLRHCDATEAARDPAAIAFRLNQPDAEAAASLSGFGAINGALMLDTIALDCQQLDDANRSVYWQEIADTFDLIGFNSTFSAEQFGRRFNVSSRAIQFVSRCSTDTAEYKTVPSHYRRGGGGILVIGNHYPHKHVLETLEALKDLGKSTPIVSFGLAVDLPHVTASYSAGHVSDEVVDGLYHAADIALFPSHYEGFGLPIMHALARRLPVIARDIPSAREIKARSPMGSNLHLLSSTKEMVDFTRNAPAWIDDQLPVHDLVSTWETAARAIAEAFEKAMERFDYNHCRHRQSRAAISLERVDLQARVMQLSTYQDGLWLFEQEQRNLRAQIEILEARASAAQKIAIDATDESIRLQQEAATMSHRAAFASREAINARVRESLAVSAEARETQRAEGIARREGALCNALREAVGAHRARVRKSPLTVWFRDCVNLAFHRRRTINDVVLPPHSAACLRLDASNETDVAVVREQLVQWGRALDVGGRISLRVASQHLLNEGMQPNEFSAAQMLFASVGCFVSNVRRRNGYVILEGTKVVAWPPYPGAEADPEFATLCHRVFIDMLDEGY